MTEELQALMLQLALKEKECPENFPGNHPGSCVCHGTDLVPLLEGVREKCPCDTPEGHEGNHCESCGWGEIAFIHDPDCSECQGRLWVSTQDPWKWFEVVGDIGGPGLSIEPLTAKEAISVIAAIFEGELAFFRALAQSLGVKDA